jgi:predicted dithiol-disulfide oxidoreductase (DUF899 family)
MSEHDVMIGWSRYAEETNVSFPGESAEYRAARDRLLKREAELRHAVEAVAAARRELPPGGPVPGDYLFEGLGPNGCQTPVRLSELFDPGKDAADLQLHVRARTRGGCPMCTAFLSLLDPRCQANRRGPGP